MRFAALVVLAFFAPLALVVAVQLALGPAIAHGLVLVVIGFILGTALTRAWLLERAWRARGS